VEEEEEEEEVSFFCTLSYNPRSYLTQGSGAWMVLSIE
jgi:hypothetical protein